MKQSDCSGMVAWLLARATKQAIFEEGFPKPEHGGSAQQHEWCETAGLKKVEYSNLRYVDKDNSRLFIAFHNPEPVGHVWLVYLGHTIECHGPRGSRLAGREWNSPVLKRIADACYELPVGGV